jgi:hypothetical protein
MPNAQGRPQCTCAPGFNNDQWLLYCCPDPGSPDVDARCNVGGGGGGGDGDGGDTADDGGSDSGSGDAGGSADNG